jgi:hypothetical protein
VSEPRTTSGCSSGPNHRCITMHASAIEAARAVCWAASGSRPSSRRKRSQNRPRSRVAVICTNATVNVSSSLMPRCSRRVVYRASLEIWFGHGR